jgi:hypothetical protein
VELYSTVRDDVGQEENDGDPEGGKLVFLIADLLVS